MGTIRKVFCDICDSEKTGRELSTIIFSYNRKAFSSDYNKSFVEVEIDICKDCEKVEEAVKDFIQNSLKKKFK